LIGEQQVGIQGAADQLSRWMPYFLRASVWGRRFRQASALPDDIIKQPDNLGKRHAENFKFDFTA
jgi:hypothetical protein